MTFTAPPEMLLADVAGNAQQTQEENSFKEKGTVETQTVEPVSYTHLDVYKRQALEFYGSSFLTDETGEVILSASRDKEEILSQIYELDELRAKRLEWGPVSYTHLDVYKRQKIW